MSGISKHLLLLSLLVAPSLASINFATHATSINKSSSRIPILSKRRAASRPRVATTTNPSLTAGSSRGPQCAFVDPVTIFSSIGTFYQTQPYASAFVTCAVKGVAADLVAQKQSAARQEKLMMAKQTTLPFLGRGGASTMPSSPIDMKRNVAFLLYSGVYQGMALELIYNNIFPKLFGGSVIQNVLMSMFVVSPFLTLPMSYLFQALVFRKSPVAALGQYWNDVRHQSLLKIFWTIWIPVQTVAFAVVPQHFRISFIAAVSFLWMILFSSIQAK